MDFNIPEAISSYLDELDAFIEAEIRPLEREDDNIRFFDHRREWARTDFENGGLPRPEWEALLREAKRRADKAGHFRFCPSGRIRWPGWIKSRHGGHSGTSCEKGAGPPQ